MKLRKGVYLLGGDKIVILSKVELYENYSLPNFYRVTWWDRDGNFPNTIIYEASTADFYRLGNS